MNQSVMNNYGLEFVSQAPQEEAKLRQLAYIRLWKIQHTFLPTTKRAFRDVAPIFLLNGQKKHIISYKKHKNLSLLNN